MHRLTIGAAFRIIRAMKAAKRISTGTVSRRGRALVRKMTALTAAVVLACALFVSCASPPEYPVYPPPETRTLSAGFDDSFRAALTVLREDARLELDTIDKAGRFIAKEKATGFILFRHRSVLDIRLEAAGPAETKMSVRLSAEDYEMGGFTREAGWYPSSLVDTFLAEDVMGLIEKRAASGS